MARGRPRKPDSIKRLEGTYRKDRERQLITTGEKIESISAPTMEMSKDAEKYYYYLANSCISMGILEKADLPHLEMCAYEYGVYWDYEIKRKELEKEVKKLKAKDQSKENDRKIDRLFNEINRVERYKYISQKAWRMMSAKLGVNPVDRLKLAVKPPEVKDDPLMEI